MDKASVTHAPEDNMIFAEVCKKVTRLYPWIDEIQYFEDKDKHVSFWVIARENSLDEPSFSWIQQAILSEFGKNHKGLKCSIHNIRQVSMRDILSQNELWKRYLLEIESRVKWEFPRDTIHILYENGVFTVYGVAPCDHNRMHAEIMTRIPHTMPCKIRFRSGVEWGWDEDASTTIHRENAAFAGVDVPSSSWFSLNISLLLGKVWRVIWKRIFPE
jgi:hypothetical protein